MYLVWAFGRGQGAVAVLSGVLPGLGAARHARGPLESQFVQMYDVEEHWLDWALARAGIPARHQIFANSESRHGDQ